MNAEIPTRARFAKWLMFSAVLSIAPLLLDYLFLLTTAPDPSAVAWWDVIKRGQLLLVCAGLGAAGVGELIGTGDAQLSRKRYAGGAAVVIVLLTAGYYALAASDDVRNPTVVVWTSIILFGFTLWASYSCVALAEEVK